MLRRVSVTTLTLLIAIPSMVALVAAEQDRAGTEWQSLQSVVSYRGVRINAVQPVVAPAAADVQEALPAPPPPVADTSPAPADPPSLVACPATEPTKSMCGPTRATIHDANSSQKKSPSKETFGRVVARIHDVAPTKAAAPQKDEARQKSVSAPAKRGCAGGGAGAGLGGRGAGADCGQCGRCGRGGIFAGRRDPCGGSHGGEQGIGTGCPSCHMYPHYAYHPEMHGYYYFKPYNWSRIAEQRETAISWGEDPQNPYAATLFEQIYADYRADQEAAAAEPGLEPAEPVFPPVPPESN